MNSASECSDIKHIVFGGGVMIGFYQIGIVSKLLEMKYYDPSKIESYYGSSAGSILSLFCILNIPFQIIEQFVIKRPWDKVFKITSKQIIDLYDSKGIYDISVVRDAFEPIFKYVDISIDITLQGLHEYTKKDLFIYTMNTKTIEPTELSHYTHPDLKVIDAILMSSSIPIMFTPVLYKSTYYIDAGGILNYPLTYCCQRVDNSNTILGIKCIESDVYSCQKPTTIDVNSNIVEFIFRLINNIFKKIKNNDIAHQDAYIKHEIPIICSVIDKYNTNVFESIETRNKYVQKGKDIANTYLWYLHHNNKLDNINNI